MNSDYISNGFTNWKQSYQGQSPEKWEIPFYLNIEKDSNDHQKLISTIDTFKMSFIEVKGIKDLRKYLDKTHKKFW